MHDHCAASLFLAAKACVVGYSLAYSKTGEFSFVAMYCLLGFVVVAASMLVAVSCIWLPEMTSKKSRGLQALLVQVLQAALSVSLLIYAIVAVKLPSQRELCIMHCSVDLSQLFVIQLIAVTVRGDMVMDLDHLSWEQVAGTMYLLWTNVNLLYLVTLFGLWAAPDRNQYVLIGAAGAWILRQAAQTYQTGRALNTAQYDTSGLVESSVMGHLLAIVLVALGLIINPDPVLRHGYFPVLIVSCFLVHALKSPLMLVFGGFAGSCVLVEPCGGTLCCSLPFLEFTGGVGRLFAVPKPAAIYGRNDQPRNIYHVLCRRFV